MSDTLQEIVPLPLNRFVVDCSEGGDMQQEEQGGIYSSRASGWIGSGMTKRKVVSKRFWFAFRTPDGNFKVQPLTSTMVPVGTPRDVSEEEFRKNFEHEPDFYVDPARVISLMPEKDRPQPVASATPGVSERKPVCDSAERAALLEKQENEARTDFGMGLTHFRRGNTRKALDIFNGIVERQVDWDADHKHMFCEFGTGLRKTRLLDVALKHYFKALELAPQDEHLHHNIARVFYEQNKYDSCREWLEKSLEINPGLAPSHQFLDFLKKSGKLPALQP